MWNIFIKPATFEARWHALIETFGLQENQWLNDMFAIKELWVPAYFREIPMSCLMKTTSRSESSNSAFKVNSTSANTLVQFMLCYESRLDSQRYRQRVAEYKTSSTVFVPSTELPIEQHAFTLYTNNVFNEVKKEIVKGKFACYVSNVDEPDNMPAIISVTQLDKRRDVTNVYQVPKFQLLVLSLLSTMTILFATYVNICCYMCNMVEVYS